MDSVGKSFLMPNTKTFINSEESNTVENEKYHNYVKDICEMVGHFSQTIYNNHILLKRHTKIITYLVRHANHLTQHIDVYFGLLYIWFNQVAATEKILNFIQLEMMTKDVTNSISEDDKQKLKLAETGFKTQKFFWQRECSKFLTNLGATRPSADSTHVIDYFATLTHFIQEVKSSQTETNHFETPFFDLSFEWLAEFNDLNNFVTFCSMHGTVPPDFETGMTKAKKLADSQTSHSELAVKNDSEVTDRRLQLDDLRKCFVKEITDQINFWKEFAKWLYKFHDIFNYSVPSEVDFGSTHDADEWSDDADNSTIFGSKSDSDSDEYDSGVKEKPSFYFDDPLDLTTNVDMNRYNIKI